MMKRMIATGMIAAIAAASWAQETNDSVFKSLSLQEVKVTAPAKTKMKGDALSTRIVGTTMAQAGTAEDVLARVPGMVRINGNLQVIGKGTPVYYINGRKVEDLTELQRLSSHDIKDVEVVSTPGARYDAQVSAVVRIRTVRQRGEGLGIRMDSRDEQAMGCGNNRWNTTFNLNYRYKNLDIFGGFTFDRNHLAEYKTDEAHESFGKENSFRQDGSTNLAQQYNGINWNAGANWQLAENQSVGFKVERHSNLKGHSDFLLDNSFLKNGQQEDYLEASTATDTDSQNSWLANGYYSGQLGKWNMDWNVDYYHTKEQTHAATDEHSQIENRQVTTDNYTTNRLAATKLVMAHPLWKGNLTFGTELAFVKRHNIYDISEQNIHSANSTVKENTYAAFVEYAMMIPKVGMLSAGARYEHVDFDYSDLQNPQDALTRHIDNIFPFASLGTQIGQLQLALSYSVKTRRPNYYILRNNIEYNNRFTLSTGNPKLQNEIHHEAGVSGRWKWLSGVVNYTYTKNGIYDWAYPYDENGTVLLGWVNFDKPIHQISAFVNASPTFGIWQPNYTVGIQQQLLSFELNDPREASGMRTVHYNKPLIICNANNAFRLPTRNEDGKGAWVLEVNSELLSDGHFGNAELRNWFWNLSVAVQKSFLRDDALSVRLSAGDLFHKAYNNVRIDLGNFILTQSHILGQERGLYDLQRLTLTVRYKWNTTKNKYKGKRSAQDIINRM